MDYRPSGFINFAEREGFEPPVPLSTPVFKTGVIDHSTISPNSLDERLSSESDCKGTNKRVKCKFFLKFFEREYLKTQFKGMNRQLKYPKNQEIELL